MRHRARRILLIILLQSFFYRIIGRFGPAFGIHYPPVAFRRAVRRTAVIAMIGIPPAEHEGTKAMRMLCKNTVSLFKIICLHLRRMPSFRLIEPFLCITYFIQPFRNQRRIRCLCLQLPVRGIPPFIRQYGKPVSFIQTVNYPDPPGCQEPKY